MTEDQRELLEEVRDSLSAAKLLLDGGYPGYAASRAYLRHVLRQRRHEASGPICRRERVTGDG